MLLTEFDANRQAIINPEALHEPLEGFPKIAVSCFSRLTFQRMLEMFPHELIYEISMANVAIPIYKLVIDDNEFVDIKGYEGLYQINRKGEVKSLERYVKNSSGERLLKETIIKKFIKKTGYLYVNLYKNCITCS